MGKKEKIVFWVIALVAVLALIIVMIPKKSKTQQIMEDIANTEIKIDKQMYDEIMKGIEEAKQNNH